MVALVEPSAANADFAAEARLPSLLLGWLSRLATDADGADGSAAVAEDEEEAEEEAAGGGLESHGLVTSLCALLQVGE